MGIRLFFCLLLIVPCLANTQVYNIRDFGADPTGEKLATSAIQAAIDACHQNGGGQVYFPAGAYSSGTLVLSSHIELHFSSGAMLLGSTDLTQYDSLHPHLLWASDATDIVLSGTGRIDGNGEAFFDKSGEGWGDTGGSWAALARPRPWLVFERCQQLRFENITLQNSPAHVLDLTACRFVYIDGIRIVNSFLSPNTDGIDIRDTRDVIISNCYIRTGDDAICLKSHRDTVQNILVNNCYLSSDDAAIKIGTGTAKAVRHCHFSNIIIDSTRFGIALFMLDGGENAYCTFDRIFIKGRSRHTIEYPIFIDIDQRYPESPLGKQSHLTFSDMQIFSRGKILIAGQEKAKLQEIELRNITFFRNESIDFKRINRKPRGNRTLSPIPASKDLSGRPATFSFGYIDGLYLENVRLIDDGSNKPEYDIWMEKVGSNQMPEGQNWIIHRN